MNFAWNPQVQNMSQCIDATHSHVSDVVTTYTKDVNGEITGVSSTITNADPCCFKVRRRLADCNLEFDNMGIDLLIGPPSVEWGMSSGNHSEGRRCIKDRLSYDENPQLVGIAPTKPAT